MTCSLRGPDGVPLHVRTTGSGTPVTVFAGGLGGTIAETRALGSGVSGTKAFFDFRGHGASGVPDDGDWSYAALIRDLRTVADATSATRAVGMSMGAAAILGVLAETPARFDRIVLYLPAILDEPRADAPTLPNERVAGVVPAAVTGLLHALATTSPVPDRAVLAHVTAPVLVVGQEGDPTHPARIAREVAAALPNATLHVFDEPGGLATHRAAVRAAVSAFLDD
jgi:pimeloyl-ACP methyl ester carboxylesterase